MFIITTTFIIHEPFHDENDDKNDNVPDGENGENNTLSSGNLSVAELKLFMELVPKKWRNLILWQPFCSSIDSGNVHLGNLQELLFR